MLADLRQATQWLTSIGIQFSATRIISYEQDIDSLLTAIRQNNIASFTQNETFSSVANSFYEASQLISIHKALHKFPDTRGLKSRLQFYVKGPLTSEKEKEVEKSHRARNYGFELFISSMFANADFDIDLDQQTDVVATKDSQSFYIECKRPRKERSFEPAIKEASSQLKAHFNADISANNQFGLIAVSVDLILHPQQNIIQVPNHQSIEYANRESVKKLFSSHTSWLNIRHPRILGVLFLLQVSTVILDVHLLTRSNYLAANSLVSPSSKNGAIFNKLIHQIGFRMLGSSVAV